MVPEAGYALHRFADQRLSAAPDAGAGARRCGGPGGAARVPQDPPRGRPGRGVRRRRLRVRPDAGGRPQPARCPRRCSRWTRTWGSPTGWRRRWSIACSCRSRSTASGRRTTWSPAGRCRRCRTRATTPTSSPAGRWCSCSAAASGARRLNEAAAAAWAEHDPGFVVVHITGERDVRAIPRRSGAPITSVLDVHAISLALVPGRRPTWWSPAPAAPCSRSPPPASPSMLVPSPNVTADHQTRTPSTSPARCGRAAARRRPHPDPAARRRWRALLSDHERLRRRWREAARRWPGPDAAARDRRRRC